MKFLASDNSRKFWLPLSHIAADQLTEVNSLLQQLSATDMSNDSWSFIWASSDFSIKAAYKSLRGSVPASPFFKWMWKSRVQNKHKFFFWLLLRDRLNTRNLLHRKNMFLESYSYVLCIEDTEETITHLFFDFPFSQACWLYLDILWDRTLPFLDMIIRARESFASNISERLLLLPLGLFGITGIVLCFMVPHFLLIVGSLLLSQILERLPLGPYLVLVRRSIFG